MFWFKTGEQKEIEKWSSDTLRKVGVEFLESQGLQAPMLEKNGGRMSKMVVRYTNLGSESRIRHEHREFVATITGGTEICVTLDRKFYESIYREHQKVRWIREDNRPFGFIGTAWLFKLRGTPLSRTRFWNKHPTSDKIYWWYEFLDSENMPSQR